MAPLLFVSSNPSINEQERYPDLSWPPDQITDFFQNRFSTDSGWVKDGRYPVLRDGSYPARSDGKPKSVAYWNAVRALTSILLEKDRKDVLPGLDFALTEVVHCKSQGEIGVTDAQYNCAGLYLNRVISIAAADVLIIYGKAAKAMLTAHFHADINHLPNGLSTLQIAGKNRVLGFLPHPSAWGKKETFDTEAIGFIRQHLK